MVGYNTGSTGGITDADKNEIIAAAAEAAAEAVEESLDESVQSVLGAADAIERLSYDRPITASGKIYGVKFPLASYSSAPAGERTEAAVGLTAAASTDETAAANDFDLEPCFMFTRVNGHLTSDGEFVETAIEGDPAFSVDGSNGDVYVRWSTRFFRYIITDTHEEIQITDI